MDLDEAVKKFANDFSMIPTDLIIKAYKDTPEELECLNSPEYFEERYIDSWPADWGTMFVPNDWTDREWIKNNIEAVEEIGFIIYSCDCFEILLGINSGGHCFYEAYWKPLYLKRGLEWHKNTA
jgi:hypothetical protein